MNINFNIILKRPKLTLKFIICQCDMKIYLVFICLGLFSTFDLFSQDPKVASFLKKVEDKMSKLQSFKTEFTLELKEAEKKPTSNKGIFGFKGSAYFVILPDLEIFSNKQDTYYYLKNRKEVQISATDDVKFDYHPVKFSKLYRTGEYEYRLNKETNNLYVIDFKPVNKRADYFKVLIIFDKNDFLINELILFYKNGDRHKINFYNKQLNFVFSDQDFMMSPLKQSGLHIEDLR